MRTQSPDQRGTEPPGRRPATARRWSASAPPFFAGVSWPAGPGISTSAVLKRSWRRGIGRVLREVRASGVVLLPYAPSSVAAARRAISAELQAVGIFDWAVRDAVLIVSELLSNAILHAYPLPGASLQVTWVVDGSWVEVAVSDGGSSSLPHAGHAPASSLAGRGLSIVAHLSDAWGVRKDELGRTVWAVLRAPRHGAGGVDGPVMAPWQVGAGRQMTVNDGMWRESACEA